jgi:hypothetical protein
MNLIVITAKSKQFNVPLLWAIGKRKEWLSYEIPRLAKIILWLQLTTPAKELFLLSDIIEELSAKKENLIKQWFELDLTSQEQLIKANNSKFKEDYEQLKQQAMNYPISQILFEFGYKPVNRGNRQMYYSFLRQEKSPSLVVYVDQNTAYDYGAGRYFNAISLYMELANANFKDTIKILSKFS